MAKIRAAAQPPASKTVKLSIPVPVEVHARLCATAALQQRDRSEVAAEILERGLRHVVIQTRGGDADPDEQSGKPALRVGNL